jgi:hypothetical protein
VKKSEEKEGMGRDGKENTFFSLCVCLCLFTSYCVSVCMSVTVCD